MKRITRCAIAGFLIVTGSLRTASAQPEAAGFSLGVAAGDVTPTSAVLWTRADEPGDIVVELATDPEFTFPLRVVTAVATADTDFCVKVDMDGLAPATNYAYRFRRADAQDRQSRPGRFRTAPLPSERAALSFIFSGDTNFSHAPFGVAGMAAREDADLFIWFGDTIYSDSTAGGVGAARTLDEYRAKYRQVRSDPGVRELLARMAMLAGWDDHEVTNDYAGRDPALSSAQRDAGYRAFFEYMPIRPISRVDGASFQTYRAFQFGAHVEFFALDGRQYRASSAAERCGYHLDPYGFIVGPILNDDGCVELLKRPRDMLGDEQFTWLVAGLSSSAATHKFVLNNVPMTFLGVFPYDRWDGYDRERRRFLEVVDQSEIPGVSLLTTDIHANAYNPDVGGYFRRCRPDYRLVHGVAVPELIVGPLGNETAAQSVFEVAGALLRAPDDESTRRVVGALGTFFTDRVRVVNGLDFIEANRVSYLLVAVSADGSARFDYRGVAPQSAGHSAAVPETFFSGVLESAPPPRGAPCGLLSGPALLVIWLQLHWASRRLRRLASPPCASKQRLGV